MPVTTAPELLERAAGHMRDRAATYDQPEGERSMGRAVAAFNAITGRDLAESEGWLLLAVLKQVRLFTRPGYHADSAEDAIAYMALLGEARQGEGQPAVNSRADPGVTTSELAPAFGFTPPEPRSVPRPKRR